MANRNTRGQAIRLQREKKKKENETKNLKKTQTRPLTKKEEKTYKASLKEGKTYTKSQLRFKEREAKGLSGLTGGKKGETIAEYRARQQKSVKETAKKKDKLKAKTTTKTTTSGRKYTINKRGRRIYK